MTLQYKATNTATSNDLPGFLRDLEKLEGGTTDSAEEFSNQICSSGGDTINWKKSLVNYNPGVKLSLGAGEHNISTGPGNDEITVSEGGSGTFHTGDGDDTLRFNTTSKDLVIATGDAGNDKFFAGKGIHYFNGGCGSDKFHGGQGFFEIFDGGPGGDKFRIDFKGGLVVIDDSGPGDCGDAAGNPDNTDDTIILGPDFNVKKTTIHLDTDGDLNFTTLSDGKLAIINQTSEQKKVEWIELSGGTRFSLDQIVQDISACGPDKGIYLPISGSFPDENNYCGAAHIWDGGGSGSKCKC